MNRHLAVVVAASAVIAAPFALAAWNHYAAGLLQVQWHDPENFSYFVMSSDGGGLTVCNPAPFFVSFDSVRIVPAYEGDAKGAFIAGGATIPPYSSADIDGSYSSQGFTESQYLYMHMDAQFDGTSPVRVDPRKMAVATEFQSSAIGLVPLVLSRVHAGFDFDQMMQGNAGEFSC